MPFTAHEDCVHLFALHKQLQQLQLGANFSVESVFYLFWESKNFMQSETEVFKQATQLQIHLLIN
jgi:hypothetical protein